MGEQTTEPIATGVDDACLASIGCTCRQPPFVSNQLGDLERRARRSGNVRHATFQLREVAVSSALCAETLRRIDRFKPVTVVA